MGFACEADAHRVLAVLSKAVREIRPGDPPGKEEAGAVGAARPCSVASRLAASRSPPGHSTCRDSRTSGGYVGFRGPGGEASDVAEPVQPWTLVAEVALANSSASRRNEPAHHTEPEASWPLRLRRDHGQLGCAVPFPLVLGPSLAMQPVATTRRRVDVPETIQSVPGAIPAPASETDPLGVPSRSKSLTRQAGCWKSAHPDLWELGVSNHPWRPGLNRIALTPFAIAARPPTHPKNMQPYISRGRLPSRELFDRPNEQS